MTAAAAPATTTATWIGACSGPKMRIEPAKMSLVTAIRWPLYGSRSAPGENPLLVANVGRSSSTKPAPRMSPEDQGGVDDHGYRQADVCDPAGAVGFDTPSPNGRRARRGA